MKFNILIGALIFLIFCSGNAFAQGEYKELINSKNGYYKGEAVIFDRHVMYPNGIEGLNKDLAKAVYPKEAKKDKIDVTVVVNFTVFVDGNIGDIKIISDSNPFFDEEAIRIIKSLKSWKPAIINGKEVEQMISLPFDFKFKRKNKK